MNSGRQLPQELWAHNEVLRAGRRNLQREGALASFTYRTVMLPLVKYFRITSRTKGTARIVAVGSKGGAILYARYHHHLRPENRQGNRGGKEGEVRYRSIAVANCTALCLCQLYNPNPPYLT